MRLEGDEVKAIADGRVIPADWLQVMGSWWWLNTVKAI